MHRDSIHYTGKCCAFGDSKWCKVGVRGLGSISPHVKLGSRKLSLVMGPHSTPSPPKIDSAEGLTGVSLGLGFRVGFISVGVEAGCSARSHGSSLGHMSRIQDFQQLICIQAGYSWLVFIPTQPDITWRFRA